MDGKILKAVFVLVCACGGSAAAQMTADTASVKDVLQYYNLVRPQLSGTAAVYILKKIGKLENQSLDRVEIARVGADIVQTFDRGLDSLNVRLSSNGRLPASDVRVVELNGHQVEYRETDSLDEKWQKLSDAITAEKKTARAHHFSRPAAAADFELEELPTEWMRAPFAFSESTRAQVKNQELFAVLALIEIEISRNRRAN